MSEADREALSNFRAAWGGWEAQLKALLGESVETALVSEKPAEPSSADQLAALAADAQGWRAAIAAL